MWQKLDAKGWSGKNRKNRTLKRLSTAYDAHPCTSDQPLGKWASVWNGANVRIIWDCFLPWTGILFLAGAFFRKVLRMSGRSGISFSSHSPDVSETRPCPRPRCRECSLWYIPQARYVSAIPHSPFSSIHSWWLCEKAQAKPLRRSWGACYRWFVPRSYHRHGSSLRSGCDV
jgi:hypothetical protein